MPVSVNLNLRFVMRESRRHVHSPAEILFLLRLLRPRWPATAHQASSLHALLASQTERLSMAAGGESLMSVRWTAGHWSFLDTPASINSSGQPAAQASSDLARMGNVQQAMAQ